MGQDRRSIPRYSIVGLGRLVFVAKVLQGEMVDVSPAGVALRFEGRPDFRLGGQVGICHLESGDFITAVNGFVSLIRLETFPGSYLVGCRIDSMEDEPLSVLEACLAVARARNPGQSGWGTLTGGGKLPGIG